MQQFSLHKITEHMQRYYRYWEATITRTFVRPDVLKNQTWRESAHISPTSWLSSVPLFMIILSFVSLTSPTLPPFSILRSMCAGWVAAAYAWQRAALLNLPKAVAVTCLLTHRHTHQCKAMCTLAVCVLRDLITHTEPQRQGKSYIDLSHGEIAKASIPHLSLPACPYRLLAFPPTTLPDLRLPSISIFAFSLFHFLLHPHSLSSMLR